MFPSVGNAITVEKTILPRSKTTMIHYLLNLYVMGEGRKYRRKGKFTDSWNKKELQLKTALFTVTSFIVTSCCVFHEGVRCDSSGIQMILGWWSPLLSMKME